MALTNRQKKIVNPFAESFDSPTRRGVGYDYNNIQNRFVLDAIHEKYLYFFELAQAGTLMIGSTRNNPRITEADLLAYFALYPQNGKVVDGESVEIPEFESKQILFLIANQLKSEQNLPRYSSRTTELTFQEEYQEENIGDPNSTQDVANLIAIPPAHSQPYKTKLRAALDLPEVQYSEEVGLNLLNLDPEVAVYVSSDSNVDLYDWRNNGLPGEDNDRVYYNPADKNYYYVRRTNFTDESSYTYNKLRNVAKNDGVGAAISIWTRYGEEKKSRYKNAIETAIREVLKLTGRNSDKNFDKLLNIFLPPRSYRDVNRRVKGAECFPLLTYKDIRPGSRWIYALKIDASIVSNLEPAPISGRLGDLRPSFEEYEISSLQKAKKLISNENQSTKSVSFQVKDMIRYLLPVRGLLREYNNKLLEEGLTPDIINGIDLDREATRLESFFELLELFCSYNKISLLDDDYVEIFFTENFSVDHICINGLFYYQGSGFNNYLNLSQESTRVVDAFSLYTPTTFSILRNAHPIYKESIDQPVGTDLNAVQFISKYIFPSQDINTLRVQRQNSLATGEKILAKRKTIFTKLSQLSNTSPEQFEALFQTRKRKYRISSTLAAINCNTGQAKVAKYALKYWSAVNSKTRWRSVIRETIILLRQEVIEDEYSRRALGLAELSVNTPGNLGESLTPAADLILRKEITAQVNQQISCTLDVLGDFIEDNFLDPLGAPPPAKTLTRKLAGQTPTIEFTLKKPLGSLKYRQTEIYNLAVETILLNFVKSIIAGVAKDLLGAVLGCGPNSGRSNNSTLRSNIKKIDFGAASLSEDLFSIDLVDAAQSASLENVERQNIDGQEVVIKSLPSLAQLQAFLNDVAKMCTPVELQQLLDGDAEFDLIEHILETVTGNQSIPFSDINPEVYNNINFSNSNIRDFFIILGDNGEDIESLEIVENSPLAAYCDVRNPLSSSDPRLGNASLSIGGIGEDNLELAADIDERWYAEIQDKLSKINTICDMAKDFTKVQIQLERLINSLPTLSWYDDFLKFIADISNSFAELFSNTSSDAFDQDQKKTIRQLAEYNLYSSEMGTELFYQIFFPMRDLPINQFYYNGQSTGFLTPASWDPERVGFSFNQNLNRDGEITFQGNFGSRRNQYTENNVYSFIWQDTRDPRNRPGNSRIEPNRLNVPQYRGAPQEPYESWDSAYYSLRNSPSSLLKRLQSAPDRTTIGEMGRVDYGARIRPDDEALYLSSVAKRVYNYFISEEIRSPYVNSTGASFLVCGAPGRPVSNINISYFDQLGDSKTIAEYDPTGIIKNELSGGTYIPGSDGNYETVNYEVFAGTEIGDSVISLNDRNHLTVDNIIMPTNESLGVRNLYANFSIGVPSANYTRRRPNQPSSRTTSQNRDEDVRSIQNYTQRIDSTINNAIITDTGKRRLARYITAINKPPLHKVDDICITVNDITRADAVIRVIQSRLSSFFLNIMPLAPVYPNWGSLGTVKLITDYLHRKIKADLQEKNILGSLYETLEYVKIVYPRISDDESLKRNPLIDQFNTPDLNVKNIVEAVYIGMIENIQVTSEYSSVAKSIFDPTSSSYEKYKNTLLKFYKILGDDNTFLPSYGISEDQTEATKEKIRQFYNEEGVTELGISVGVYYFPIAFQIASYMIYYDKGIKYSNRFSQTNYNSLLEMATADDGLLSALKGQPIFKFAQGFSGFPVSVVTWNEEREISYYNQQQVLDRISSLDDFLSSYDQSLSAESNIYDLSFLASRSQDGEFTIRNLYDKYFSSGPDAVLYKNNRIQYRSRGWRPGLRDATLNEINSWFMVWSGPDEPTLNPVQELTLRGLRTRETILEGQIAGLGDLAPPALIRELNTIRQNINSLLQEVGLPEFSYNRNRNTSILRAADANLPDQLRDGEDIWIAILENNYKDIEVDLLTPRQYFQLLSDYFLQISIRYGQVYESELALYREENGNAPVLDEIKAFDQASIFFSYVSALYIGASDIGAKVLEEKSILEKLITTNE